MNAAIGVETISDEEAIACVLAGEASMFDVLMRRYNQRLFRAIRSIIGNDDETQDIMQEAYVSAYLNLRQFEGRVRFSTWLTRIAVNEALARLRINQNSSSLR